MYIVIIHLNGKDVQFGPKYQTRIEASKELARLRKRAIKHVPMGIKKVE